MGGFAVNDSSAKISVIQSRLPYIDRRSLSEAWFSALHFAAGEPARRTSSASSAPAPASAAAALGEARALAPRDAVAHLARVSAPRRQNVRSAIPDAAHLTRVAPRTARDSRSVVRTRPLACFRAALAVGVSGERVQLLVRRDGTTLHVVALCRPQVAALVRRALDVAAAHLRACGLAAHADVRAVALLPPAVSA
jgi:hypothetical protein